MLMRYTNIMQAVCTLYVRRACWYRSYVGRRGAGLQVFAQPGGMRDVGLWGVLCVVALGVVVVEKRPTV